MKIKTSELQGAALDWAVATADGEDYFKLDVYAPSQLWEQCGLIIEHEGISINSTTMRGQGGNFAWLATRVEGPAVSEEYGLTPLIAAMRCFVASHLGDEIEVPNELIGE